MRYNFLLLLFLVLSCGLSKKASRSRKDIENLKQMAYCKCLTYSINIFVGKDSIDMSFAEVENKMNFYGGYFLKNMYPLLDSASKSTLLSRIRVQYDKGRAEGAYGCVNYKLGCLEFYKSKELDSLVRVLSKRINDSIYNDSFYKNLN